MITNKTVILVCISLSLISCHGIRELESSIIDNDCKSYKIAHLKEIARFVKSNEHSIYNFLENKIIVPESYDTIRYQTKLGRIQGVRKVSAIKLEYGQMLYNLIDSCNYTVQVSDIIKNYHLPTAIGTNRNGDTLSLGYYLNSKAYPDCYTPNDLSGQYRTCDNFSFEFDENGNLIDMNGIFFYE